MISAYMLSILCVSCFVNTLPSLVTHNCSQHQEEDEKSQCYNNSSNDVYHYLVTG